MEREGGMTVPILTPYRVSRALAFVGRLEGVVNARDDDEKVRYHRTDFVRDYTASGIFISSFKWIHFDLVSHLFERETCFRLT